MKRFLSLLAAGVLTVSAATADAQITQQTNRISLVDGAGTVTLMPSSAGTRQISFPAGTLASSFLITHPTSAMTLASGGLTLGAGIPLTFTGFTEGTILFAGADGVTSNDPDLTWDATSNIFSVPNVAATNVRLMSGANYLTLSAPTLVDNLQVFTFPTTGGTLITQTAGGTTTFGDDEANPNQTRGVLELHDNTAANTFTQSIAAANDAGMSSTVTIPAVGAAAANFVLTNAAVDQTIDDVTAITNDANIAINPGGANKVTTDGNFEINRDVSGFATGTYNAVTVNAVSSVANDVDVRGIEVAVTGTDGSTTGIYTHTTAPAAGGEVARGIHSTSSGTGAGTNVGVEAAATGSTGANYAIRADATGTNAIGVYVTNGGIQVDNGALNLTSEGITNAGSIAGATTIVASTSVTAPSVIGSTATDGTLTLTGSTGAGPHTGGNNAILFNVGNNGATTAMDIDHNGTVNIPTVNIDGGTLDNVTLTGVNLGASITLGSEVPVAAGTLVLHDANDDLADAGVTAYTGTIQTGDLTANSTYTFPNASGTVMLQSAGGNITLGDATAPTPGSITLHDNDGGANGVTINTSTIATAGLEYSLPDVLLDASFVMTEGTQVINGNKEFTSALNSVVNNAVTATFTDALTLGHNTTGTAAANFGVSMLSQLEDDGGSLDAASRINTYWAVPTHPTEDARMSISLMNAGAMTEVFVLDEDGNLSIDGDLTSGGVNYLKLTAGASQLLTGNLYFDGSGAGDGFETQFAITNPTVDRTITFPNASGTVMLSGSSIEGDIVFDGTLDRAINLTASGGVTGNDLNITGGSGTTTGGDVTIGGGTGGTTNGSVLLTGVTEMTVKHGSVAGDPIIDLSGNSAMVVVITEDVTVEANEITPPTTPKDGEMLYIVNQDNDNTSDTGVVPPQLQVAAGATGLFMYRTSDSRWLRILP